MEQYSCDHVHCGGDSRILFVVNEVILRLFVPMAMLSTVILIVSFHRKPKKSKLSAVRFVLSPSSMAAVFLISLFEVHWWRSHKTLIVTVWTVVYGLTVVLQCFVFAALLDIQDNGICSSSRSLTLSPFKPQ